MVPKKKESSARHLFSKRVDKRSRAEMTAYLAGHFRYYTMHSWNRSTSYASNMKLYNLGLDREVADKLWDMIQVPDFYDQLNETSETVCYQEFGSSHLSDIQKLRTLIGKRLPGTAAAAVIWCCTKAGVSLASIVPTVLIAGKKIILP